MNNGSGSSHAIRHQVRVNHVSVFALPPGVEIRPKHLLQPGESSSHYGARLSPVFQEENLTKMTVPDFQLVMKGVYH